MKEEYAIGLSSTTKEKIVTLFVCVYQEVWGEYVCSVLGLPDMQEHKSQDTSRATTEGFSTPAVMPQVCHFTNCMVEAHKGHKV